MNEIWIGLVGAITTVVSGFVSWFFTKKKYYTEVDHNVIENMSASLEFYKALVDDNKARLEESLRENAELRNEVKELRAMVDKLTMTLANYGLDRLLEDADIKGELTKPEAYGNKKEETGKQYKKEV